ncbi:MAG TPA: glycosyltransferase family 39 protein [Phycisphaerae bacterium]|nr:glycosyltransferase family 39 protein [Phycisphaerae bacterium]
MNVTTSSPADEVGTHPEHPAATSRRWGLDLVILLFVFVATLVPVTGGPKMGDHEALVAQCARDMRMTGNWLVPHYLGEPYVRKPPLPYWIIAGLSYVLPHDPNTGLPVTTFIARLPSALAAFGTVLLLWQLAAFMFSPRVGRVTAVVGASSLFFLLYAPNATVEMLLTFCCVWAHFHFWIGVNQPLGSNKRRLHFFFYYVALGMGMMAKGPFPLVMVALPIAAWWYLDRPLSFVAQGTQQAWSILLQRSPGSGKAALRAYGQGWTLALADLFGNPGIGRRTIQAFKELYILPGLVVFALCFVPWMYLVGREHPHAWNLWNWQYMQRVQGKYDDTRPRGIFYYVPRIAGMVLPWVFMVFEAAAAPWLRKYARERSALLYAGLWALIGAVVMSLIEFKKPYYVAPMIPALVLLLGVVAERFYAEPQRWIRPGRVLLPILALAGVGGLIGGYFFLRREMPDLAMALTIIAAGTLVLLLLAGLAFVLGRAWVAFGLTATTSVLAFMASWFFCGQAMNNIGKVTALHQVLEDNGVPDDADVYWVSRRQDSRLSFYYARYTKQMIQPAEIVNLFVDRTKSHDNLRSMVMDRARSLLESPKPVYLILDRDEYGLAKMAGMGNLARVIGFAPDEAKKDSDWMVITNVKE